MNAAARIGVVLVGLFFVMTAGLKAWSPWSVSAVLDQLGWPHSLRLPTALFLVAFEGAIGAMLIYGRASRRLACLAGLVFLALVTPALFVFLSMREPPSCGCLGGWQPFRSGQTELVFGIGRNFVLAGALVMWLGTGAAHPRLSVAGVA